MKFQRDLILVLAVDFFSYVPTLRIVEKINRNNIGQNRHSHTADTREVEAGLCREFIEVEVADKQDAGENLDIGIHIERTKRTNPFLGGQSRDYFCELFLRRAIRL